MKKIEQVEGTSPETWPQDPQNALAGQTTYAVTFHCAGRIQSDTMRRFFTCPTTATVSTAKPNPAGWEYLKAHGGWHCPSCAENPGHARRPMGKYHDMAQSAPGPLPGDLRFPLRGDPPPLPTR